MLEPIDEIRQQIARHCKTSRYETALGGLTLFRTEEERPPVNTIYRPTLCLVAQGRKQVMLGDRIFEYDPSRYLVVTVDLPVRGCIVEGNPEHPYLGLMLQLDPVRIADLLIGLPADLSPTSRPAAMAMGVLDNRLLEPVARLLRLLDAPDDMAVMQPLIEREILFRLVQGGQGSLLRQIATAGSQLAQVGRAAEWIRTHYAEPMSVEALAEQVGMSVTSFHRRFKAITTMSPLRYRAQIRLQEARRLMVVDEHDAGTIGFKVGYESPSQFSRDYRKMFGLPPGADAARLRAEAITPPG
jgi:AraC-like DNA-binding protein